MMQSPQILYALARQQDRIDPPCTVAECELRETVPMRHSAVQIPEPRLAWVWQLLFRRGGTVAS